MQIARWMAQKAKDADKVNAENETQTRWFKIYLWSCNYNLLSFSLLLLGDTINMLFLHIFGLFADVLGAVLWDNPL